MIRTTEDALIHLLVERMAARVTAAAIVDWATDALVAGEDTPSLVILAGLDRTASVFEITPWLDKAISELKVVPPPAADLRRAFVGVVKSGVDGRPNHLRRGAGPHPSGCRFTARASGGSGGLVFCVGGSGPDGLSSAHTSGY